MSERFWGIIGLVFWCGLGWVALGFVARLLVWLFCIGYGCQ